MKKSKIIVALLLAFVIVFGIVSLVACDNNKDDRIELVLWAPSNEMSFYKDWTHKWAYGYTDEDGVEHPGYVDSQGRSYDVYVTNMETDGAKEALLNGAEDGADVFLFIDDHIADLANAGILSPVGTGPLAQDVIARNSSSSVASATYQGQNDTEEKLYAYPMQADNTYYLYYNSKYLNEEDVTSWDNIFAKLDEINADNEGVSKKVAFDYGTGWYAASWFFTFGGWVTTTETNFNEIGAKALEAAYQFSTNTAVKFQGPDASKQELAKADGEIVACVAGGWIYASPDENTPTGVDQNPNIKLTILPKVNLNGEEKQMKAFISSKLIGVNGQLPYGVASHQLANFLTSEAVQKDKAIKLMAGPSNINAANDPEVAELPTIKAAAQQANFASPQINLPINFWEAVQDAVNDVKFGSEAYTTYFNEDGSPKADALAARVAKLAADMFTSLA